MVICKRCQSENQDQTRFCTFCGGRLPGRVEPLGAATQPAPATPATAAAAAKTVAPRAGGPRPDPDAQARYTQKVVYQHFIRAKELIRERKFDAAIKEFTRALEVSPGEPTITQMLAKTLSAQKAAQAAQGEPASHVTFRPAPTPAKSSIPAALTSAPPAPRHPAADMWFKTLAAAPAIYPSMVLDTPTNDRILEFAVTAFILGGVVFFGFLLTV